MDADLRRLLGVAAIVHRNDGPSGYAPLPHRCLCGHLYADRAPGDLADHLGDQLGRIVDDQADDQAYARADAEAEAEAEKARRDNTPCDRCGGDRFLPDFSSPASGRCHLKATVMYGSRALTDAERAAYEADWRRPPTDHRTPKES